MLNRLLSGVSLLVSVPLSALLLSSSRSAPSASLSVPFTLDIRVFDGAPGVPFDRSRDINAEQGCADPVTLSFPKFAKQCCPIALASMSSKTITFFF
ncbi:hypothetical protein NDU88_005520 [Pleurodeles waltl]|uniref:Uncharacterized protein n=1 Tax=Pleurodeles waltl TaxID=8319 RepID=A0AAV7TCH9_PLEWA|nr:hypothetical protein NDU88_005520 [Pleurodeles waltl]